MIKFASYAGGFSGDPSKRIFGGLELSETWEVGLLIVTLEVSGGCQAGLAWAIDGDVP